MVQYAMEEIDKVVRLLQITPGIHVLDLGCGIGRDSLELARRGFKVTGIDRTESYLQEARGQAVKEKLDIEFVRSDMRSFRRSGAFDAVINMFTTFGYFENADDDRKVIENVVESLKPGGAFILDTHGKESLARIFQKREWREQDGVFCLQEHSLSRNWSWMENRWIMIRNNERIEHNISHRLYAGSEMAALFSGCGFSRVDIYGDLEGHPYDETARRLVAVGHK
jgi:SAM-dependent methyltransferase